MRILATGTTGFIGRHVARALVAGGHALTPMGRDLRRLETFPAGAFDLVFHAAAMVDKRYWGSADMFEVNVQGTRNLLDRYPEAKMVFLSSADVEREPLTPYGESKKQAEAVVLAHGDTHLVIRPPSVFGPGDTHDKLVPRLFAHHRFGVPMTLCEGTNELLYVGDLARQVAAGLERRGVWRIPGRKITNAELDRLIGAVCRGEEPEGLDSPSLYVYEGLRFIRDALEMEP